MEIKKRIIVLSGRQGAGKTTYAKLLRDLLGNEYCRIFKFAAILYRLHDACLPILQDNGIVPKDVVKEGALLQVLGTEYGRMCKGENVWADACRRAVESYLLEDSKNFAIIDDCRFENEFDLFYDFSHMVRLTAPTDERKARCSAWRENDNHASETSLDNYEKMGNFDYVIVTDSDGNPAEQAAALLESMEIFV